MQDTRSGILCFHVHFYGHAIEVWMQMLTWRPGCSPAAGTSRSTTSVRGKSTSSLNVVSCRTNHLSDADSRQALSNWMCIHSQQDLSHRVSISGHREQAEQIR